MFNLFKSQHCPILGVDISSTAVRILELSIDGVGHAVRVYAIAPLPIQTIDGHTIQQIEVVASTIKKLLTTAPFFSTQAACAIPDALAISKTIQINAGLCHQAIEALVMAEAARFIPYPLSDVYLDFTVLGPWSQNNAKHEVLIVASRSGHVQERVDVLTLAGLEPVLVDVESDVVERTVSRMVSQLPRGSEKKTIVILEIEDESTHLFLLQEMRVISAREAAFDGGQLTASFYDSVLLNLRSGLQFFSVTSLSSIDYILLAGRHARRAGLSHQLQQHLNIPIAIANPLGHMNHSSQVDSHKIIDDAPLLMRALGLALRSGGASYESY